MILTFIEGFRSATLSGKDCLHPCGSFAGISCASSCTVRQIRNRRPVVSLIKSVGYTFLFALIMPVSVVRVHP